jgi:hypothetical protein
MEIPIAEGMYRNSMSNRSWARALSASAAIAINRVNYAYLIPIIQFAIAPTHSPHRGRFLSYMRHPYHAPVVCSTRLILIGLLVVLTCSSSWHILSVRIHPHTTCVLSPTYFVKSYVCAHITLYAHPPLTLLLVLLWTIIGFLCTRWLLYPCSSL